MTTRKSISTRSMIERLIYINQAIIDNQYPNTKKLAETLEVSVATIYRDLEFLKDRLHAPIQYDHSRTGYFYSDSYNLLENL